MCQSMCKRLQSGNNTFRFLLDDAAHRNCSWRAYIFCQTRSDLETAGERIRVVYFTGNNITPTLQ